VKNITKSIKITRNAKAEADTDLASRSGRRLKLKNLQKIYRQTNEEDSFVAMQDLSLELAAGEFVSIIGESGCGKSTLFRMIAGLESPSSGTVFFGGEEVCGTSPDRGLMFQEHTLFPWLSVKDNIVFALKSSGQYKSAADTIDHLIETAGLQRFADSYPHQLSGGMRQRAALIRSLAVSPDLLLLDEPLGALDNFTRMSLQDEIIRLWQERKNTMMLITHDVDEAIYLSNKVVVMSPRPGRISRIIEVPLSYPRNRASSDFIQLRTQLLKYLNFATEVQQEYYL
jgi:ABC-type nitrate/sulfonate/bicarbonate transport system ATPase subunit